MVACGHFGSQAFTASLLKTHPLPPWLVSLAGQPIFINYPEAYYGAAGPAAAHASARVITLLVSMKISISHVAVDQHFRFFPSVSQQFWLP